MEELDNTNSILSNIGSPPSPISADIEDFCLPCRKFLIESSLKTTQLHENVASFCECAKICPLCAHIYAAFGDDFIHNVEVESKPDKLPSVYMSASNDGVGENRCVEKITLRVDIEAGTWLASKHFGMRTFAILSGSARGYDRAIWSNPTPVDFNARAATISSWIEECNKGHHRCRQTLPPSTPQAARMLETHTESGDPHLRLVPTDNLELYKIPYIVLSHCWGGIKIEAETNEKKIKDYYKFIDITTLPKTFREAIQITRALNFRYLWIDTLCIIQGSKLDWECESAKMASIFQGATLTLSASSAKNSREGCGISNVLTPATQFTITAKQAPGRQSHFSIRAYGTEDPKRSMTDVLLSAPVHKRAWIFQEKVLSHRILHATHSQFVFQCATHVEREDSLVYGNHKGGSDPWETLSSHVPEHVVQPTNPQGGIADIRYQWWHWARDYMKRGLTKATDNYAAIAGVTALYQDLTGDEPVLGLWRRDLELHLSWGVYVLDGSVPPSDEERRRRQPSWTWLSFQHGTIWPWLHSVDWKTMGTPSSTTTHQPLSPICYRAEVLDVDVQWAGRPLVTSPSRATLKLRGYRHSFPRLTQQTGGRLVMDCSFIEAEKDHNMYEVFALFAITAEGPLITDPLQLHIEWLIIEATDRVEGEYRRLGRYETWFDLAPERKIEEQLLGTYEEIMLV